MSASNKEMYLKLLKDTLVTLLIVVAVILISVLILHYFFKTEFATTSPSLVFGIAGTVLAFIGSIFSNDAVNRWGGSTLPQWKWGNRIQLTGFSFVIVALLIK